MAGQRHRPWEAALVELAVGIGAEAEHAGRVEVVAEDSGDTLGGVAFLHRVHRHHRIVEGRLQTEIESWDGR